MEQEKMYLINKIFNNETIRTVWDKESEKYFVSELMWLELYQKVRMVGSIGIN